MEHYKALFIHEDYNKFFFNRKEDIKRLEYQINAVKESISQQILIVGVKVLEKLIF